MSGRLTPPALFANLAGMPQPADNLAIQHVSDTALWVAHYRAVESERPDALFRDPFAKILVGERGRKIAESMKATSRFTKWTVVIRTCIIDGFIQKLTEEGPNSVDTVINLGAGLDTRPYRLKLPKKVRWVEVDYPHMIEHKEKLLASETPGVQLERIALDLSDRQKRQELFARLGSQSQKALILTEGVIPYLTEEQVATLAEDLHSQKSFRFWIGEYFAPWIYRHIRNPKRMKNMKNAPFRFFPADWFGFFERGGWKPLETRYFSEESQKLGRASPMPWWFSLTRLFMNREKLRQLGKMSGYVLYTKIE
jgi:methyltransferase (TIGR00027 family)